VFASASLIILISNHKQNVLISLMTNFWNGGQGKHHQMNAKMKSWIFWIHRLTKEAQGDYFTLERQHSGRCGFITRWCSRGWPWNKV